jgi:hypothetical protein
LSRRHGRVLRSSRSYLSQPWPLPALPAAVAECRALHRQRGCTLRLRLTVVACAPLRELRPQRRRGAQLRCTVVAASRCWRQLALPAVVECRALLDHYQRGCTLRLLWLAVVA